MKARAILTALILLAAPAAASESCPVPEPFVIAPDMLRATRHAVTRKDLTIVTFGGSTPIGAAARGPAYSYPSRLEHYLGERLPDVSVHVVILADAPGIRSRLSADLATHQPALVIWGPGGRAAARDEDTESFNANVKDGIARIQATGADVLLMTLQYAPSIALLLNLPPYRDVVLEQAAEARIPVLDRYELMRFWSEAGFLNFDATDKSERVKVARELYDCMAEILSDGIANAVR